MNQKFFLNTISRYFNTAALSPSDKILSAVSPAIPIFRNASKIKNAFDKSELPQNENNEAIFKIQKYAGKDNTALQIISYIQKYLSEDLELAIVHGSIATDEKINYSDFDGLVVIKNEVFKSNTRIRYVAEHLSKSYSLMIMGDPLQHHGWFVLTEKDLLNWPCSYFPPVIFDYSRSLLGHDATIRIKTYDNCDDCVLSLNRMSLAIKKTLSTGKFPDNAYQLKSLLSEFMLLPTLFIQAVTEKGIYKKNSFEAARTYFKHSEWQVMDDVSDIRSQWNINEGIKFSGNPVLITPWIKKKQVRNSLGIPAELKHKLSDKLLLEMLHLTDKFVSVPK